ncbi:MAG: endolytic transglycosylase MltG [Lysobacterales bacterium CG02_land_8_20_14_3_00_62_12]|nr:MAG: endolytic transglycosylase MltG [Xanthomonadales bacterium CG02_land_8_20_14_3_00_62_12]
MLRKLLKTIFTLGLIAVLIGGGWLWRDYRAWSAAPLRLAQHELVLNVVLGTSFNQIVSQLRRAHVSNAPRPYWRVLAHEMKVLDGLRAGEYALTPGMTPRRLLDRMAKGLVIQHQFTIIAGWRFADLRQALAKAPLLKPTLAGLSDQQIMERLGHSELNPEGRFLPETYSFIRGQRDIDVLKHSFRAMQSALAAAWQERAGDLPLASTDALLTLASIVEKETGRAVDRDKVAGVFIRRLRMGMKLQTDPTVIYGLGSAFNGNLTRRHLETDTPYNTYTRAGLPPAPIALPSREALLAVVHPAAGDALYFVAKGDGSTEFSARLEDHNRAVQRYQLP